RQSPNRQPEFVHVSKTEDRELRVEGRGPISVYPCLSVAFICGVYLWPVCGVYLWPLSVAFIHALRSDHPQSTYKDGAPSTLVFEAWGRIIRIWPGGRGSPGSTEGTCSSCTSASGAIRIP